MQSETTEVRSVFLTAREKVALEAIASASLEIFELLEQDSGSTHPNDLDEAVPHIHALQRIIMARPVRRSHPELFGQRYGNTISTSLLKKAEDPLPSGCYCKPGRCEAPKIMGRQMPCRDPKKAASVADVDGPRFFEGCQCAECVSGFDSPNRQVIGMGSDEHAAHVARYAVQLAGIRHPAAEHYRSLEKSGEDFK